MPKIIIIGASSGIGRLMAEEFASKGWTVGAGARNAQALRSLEQQFPENIVWETVDITDNTSPEQLKSLISKTGGMDFYLHVSGICRENGTEIVTEDECATALTNVDGFTRMIDTAYNYFKENDIKGHIAAITSVAGTKGIGELPAYSASKRYQWTYLQALRQTCRLNNTNIYFTDIRPGWTRTPLISTERRYLMAMDPKKVAQRAVRAVIRKEKVVYIDRRWRIMAFFWRLLPGWLWTLLPIHSSSAVNKRQP